jgi:hypothetical protein
MCIWIVTLFDEAFKYGDGVNFLTYFGTNTEPFCVVFCNFVQCDIFVAYVP